ncbi:Tetratricopeptide repeat-containing protein [Lutibacter oricola]|uniref:Tetratricopeptide repeat-containing protein n=1 Tax=Lutibacter oricola TaxID=762486 RepID=A0A1H3BJP1_9FLAO|nr:tetratricopeptide repeat protein [Lutibacter oricola]SDX42133.1 Tetratricopeptide repeat-containing protein [Lutibacter oricola]
MTKKINKHWHKITLTLLFGLVFGWSTFIYAIQSTYFQIPQKKYINKETAIADSITSLEIAYTNLIKKGDTLNAIRTLNNLARVYSHQGNHKESYDKLWAALILADTANKTETKSSIYREIGRHYSYYHRKDKAIHFLNLSLNIKKELVKKGKIDKHRLVNNYSSFVSTYRELNNFELGEKYLDSCYIYFDTLKNKSRANFLKFEEAVILSHKGKDDDAIAIFNNLIPKFTNNQYGYLVLIYKYLGDSYQNNENFIQSQFCYKKAIEVSELKNVHKDFIPLVYEGLSSLYFSKGKYLQAYNSLKKAKDLDAVFFDSRSPNNAPLLEIQDDFRKDKELQIKTLQEQKLKQFEQEEKVELLEKILLLGLLMFLLLFGYNSYRALRTKHKIEKKLLKKERELEKQKDTELIELKNKELAASVLKLIEKDVFLEQIKDRLSKTPSTELNKDTKKIISSISNKKNENWNEFQARFVAINKSFYKKLEADFPNLTMNDQKLCALIKLNFSSKDIAQLLNMSIESVHTTRSRLRKKLNITREVNLKKFISNI